MQHFPKKARKISSVFLLSFDRHCILILKKVNATGTLLVISVGYLKTSFFYGGVKVIHPRAMAHLIVC